MVDGPHVESPTRLLVVDDERDILIVIKTVLKARAGFDVHTCARSADAVAMATDIRPHAVLLDFMMPGLNGEETLAALRNAPETRETPVIFMTARHAVPPALLARPHVMGLIEKPFDQRTIADRVTELLGATKSPRQSTASASPDVAKLLGRYRAELPGRVATIEACWDRIPSDHDGAVLKEMLTLTHRLSGTGTTFGFPAVSTAAAALERALESDHTSTAGKEGISALLDALRVTAE